MKKNGQMMVEYFILFVAVAIFTIFAVSNMYQNAKSSAAGATTSACGRIAAGS